MITSLLTAALLALAPDAPVPERVRLYDVTADVLAPGQDQLNLFFANYIRGVAPGLQLSSHLAGNLVSLANLTGKYQFFNRPELRSSFQAGGYWLALASVVDTHLLFLPLELRSTVPLTDRYELSLAAAYRILLLTTDNSTLSSRNLRTELVLTRYDRRGAWLLVARFPLTSTASLQSGVALGNDPIGGSLTLDNLPAWSVLVGRDLTFGKSAHVRLGIGYRNKPGIVLLESFNRLLLNLDLYWR